jgi:hypothetical protein
MVSGTPFTNLIMQNSYLDHPAEEALERFLLHQCPDEELETVETHILGCGSCVSRLETLETQVANLRLGFEELERQRTVAVAAKQHRSWKTWFTVPNLAWAGAAAVVVVGLAITPQLLRHTAPLAEVSLIATRGAETTAVPQGRPLHVHLNAAGLPEAPVSVELVDGAGTQLWRGSGLVRHDQVNVTTPQIISPGDYFLRLYAPGRDGQPGDLLREFALQVK